jgi:predicted PurR-regulated permease PerM
MDGQNAFRGRPYSPGIKLAIVAIVLVLAVVLVREIHAILAPFLWALVAAYLIAPIVNYLNVKGGLPRLWSVFMIYALTGMGLYAASRYLYPVIVNNGTVFLEDIPRLEAAVIGVVGPRPLGIDITSVIDQLVRAVTGYTGNTNSASNLLVNAVETLLKLFLFLVSTFYLLMDSARIKQGLKAAIPEGYRAEIVALGTEINLTWQQYIRGEIVLFLIMAITTTIGLEVLQVPGALFLGLTSGALELLPLVGPWTAGALAVSVAYFSGSNPYGWQQIAYAGVIALMYFILRQLEDYLVIPHVIGRAVRLHPLVVILVVTAGGVVGGFFGLLIAVPVAASIREVLVYLYCKVFDLPLHFDSLEKIDGARNPRTADGTAESESALPPSIGRPQGADAS